MRADPAVARIVRGSFGAEVAEQLAATRRKWDSSQPDLALLRQKYEGVEISEEIRERVRQLGYIE